MAHYIYYGLAKKKEDIVPIDELINHLRELTDELEKSELISLDPEEDKDPDKEMKEKDPGMKGLS